MPLSAGSQLGPYRLIAHIGAGGMGEVYRAKDTRLARDVALKILPDLFSKDTKRTVRFTREAKALASLNHPHIAQIYGFEDSDGVHALVLELVEGQDLAERIARGPIPVEEALAMARQIAEALEFANDRGVVHRDLKPANIKVTPDGVVKVLDFGLAKLTDDIHWRPSQSLAGSPEQASHPPTLTVSSPGMLFGTPGYMSPEQARGQSVDKRADIWAFGCVLYEMLTGKRIFEGDSVTDVLVAVIQETPDWTRLPASVPSGVRNLLVRCLQKDPKVRLRDIGEARIALAQQSRGGSLLGVQLNGGTSPPRESRAGIFSCPALSVRLLPWTLVVASVIALGIAVTRRSAVVSAAPVPVSFGVVLPAGYILSHDDVPILDLSLDGQTLVFVAQGENGRVLLRRRLGEAVAESIQGTEEAQNPFFSPDGQWVGFFADGKLKKVPIDGGTAMTLASVPTHRSATWGAGGWIVYSPSYTSGLFRIRDTGGTPEPLTTLDLSKRERTHRWPTFLPEGQWVLFTMGKIDSPALHDGDTIAAVNVETRERRTVFEGASMARFAPPDHLLLQRGTSLLTLQLDPNRLTPRSLPSSLREGIRTDTLSGAGYFTVSATGTLAFVPQEAIPEEKALILVDPDGLERALPLEPGAYVQPRFSPDGTRLVFGLGAGSRQDENLWIYDIARNHLRRFTFVTGSTFPSWSPDGRWIAFAGNTSSLGLFKKAVNGRSEDVPLWTSGGALNPDSWLPDGSALAVTNTEGRFNSLLIPSDGGRPTDMKLGPKDVREAAFSPDGHHVAYVSYETGTVEIFVQSWPIGHGKWQVSPDGGESPVWSHDGRCLVYIKGEALMAIDVDTHEGFQVGPPRQLFRGRYDLKATGGWHRNFDLALDGRFIFIRRYTDRIAPRQLEVEVGVLSPTHAAR